MIANEKSLLEELRIRKRNIDFAQEIIDRETIKYYESIKRSQEYVLQEKKKLEKVKEDILFVNLQTLINEIAKEWNANPDSLRVELKIGAKAEGKETKKSMAKLFSGKKGLTMTLQVVYRKHFFSASNPLILIVCPFPSNSINSTSIGT